ncbi:MAG TPA: DNA polymerase III subunit alpha, partial [Patescibacteria group bacterium]|nr:DNA polymerase III subunit alpha [Patescibacteria group bacterium]
IIKNALRIIRRVHDVDIDLSTLPLDDTKTYELFQRGDTTGVFQLESAGMKRYLRALKPTVFEDIIAMVALYRPGPMQFIDSFIKRKHGEESITYLHEGLEPSLASTYGILIYQEQFMQISKDWSGFTGGQADTLRKAVGKKNIDLMKKVKPEFIEGAIKVSGASKEVAELFWDQLEEFANYSFNKSHAACYGLIAYWTAYLKAHYPEAFMAALMTSDQDDTDRLAIEMTECRHMGIDVLSPDVNESFVEFAVVPGKKQIRFGMAAVKGVGVGAVEEILRVRAEGRFDSIEDFASRVASNKVNKKSWESLVKAGAFDAFGDRSDLLFNLEDILAFASKLQKEKLSGQADLFGGLEDDSAVRSRLELKSAPQRYTEREQLMWERELMGLYISAHPLDNYDAFFEEQAIGLHHMSPTIDGQSITIGGLVTTMRTIVTKSGKKMAFVAIEDKTGETEIIVFPNLFEQLGQDLAQDKIIKATGRVSARDRDGNLGDEAKLIADEIAIISDKELRDYESTGRKMNAPKNRAPFRKRVSKDASATRTVAAVAQPVKPVEPVQEKTLYLRVENASDTDALLALKSACSAHPGNAEVVLVLGPEKKALRMPFRVSADIALTELLAASIGEDAVILK